MVDWFVVLIPLVLLPALLFLVFVGCTLDRSGTALDQSPINFTYPDVDDVLQLEVSLSGSVTFTNDSDQTENESVAGSRTLTSQGSIVNGGETFELGRVPLISSGSVTCSCKIEVGFGSKPPVEPLTKLKNADEDAPGFTLVRTGGEQFHLE